MSNLLIEQTYNHFVNVTDPRVNRGTNHPLFEMIFISLCASICGADNWVDVERYGNAKIDWLRKFFPLEDGIPSHDTFGRVFARLDTLEFYEALQSFTNALAESLRGETIAVDGKTLRGSFDNATSKSALHSVSAWACGMRLCLGVNSVDPDSNEIPAVQELIKMLQIDGAVITADAMHCQKETAALIIDKNADYILMAKANQKALQDEISNHLHEAFEAKIRGARKQKITEKNRGREETREVWVMPCPKDSKVLQSWKGIATIGLIYRSRTVNGKVEESFQTFIASLPCRVRDIAKRLREHWRIENSQHYTLDVTFREDSSRIRKGNGPEISSVFRRLALTILQQDTTQKDRIIGKRKRCGWDNRALEQLMSHFTRR